MKKYPGLTFGRAVKAYREDVGMSAQALADYLEVSKSYITKIERHNEIPSPDVVRKIAKYIVFPEDRLLKIAFKGRVIRCAEELYDRYGIEGLEFDKLWEFIYQLPDHPE